MKYAFFGFEGTGFPLAHRLIAEGKDVLIGQVDDISDVLTSKEKKNRIREHKEDKAIRLKRYKNILPKTSAKKLVEILKEVKNPKEWFVFFESNCLFYYAQQLQNVGFQGNFPTEKDRLFEIDRDVAKNFVKKHYPHIQVAPKQTFTSVEETTLFLQDTSKQWVIKSHTDEVPTFIPENDDPSTANQQIIDYINTFKNHFETSGIFLEQLIQNVLEIDPEIMFYDGVPISLCIDMENKFIGSANLSYQVGCAGDLNFPISMKSKIFEMCFPKIVFDMAKNHKGLFIWDASILIDSKTHEIYFSEFCPNRPRYNTIFTYLSQVPSVDYFFKQIVSQTNPFSLGSVGTSISVFNLPQAGKDGMNDCVTSVDLSNKHHWLIDIYKKKEEEHFRSVGYEALFGVITGNGTSIYDAVTGMYENVSQVSLPNMYYRPKFDFLSKEYPTSVLNRLEYAVEKDLFTLPFSY